MATYQILCWKEYPSQVKAEGNGEEVKIELEPRFQELIDKIATEKGAIGSDEYLDGWNWSDPKERPGSAADVAQAVKRELEKKFPK